MTTEELPLAALLLVERTEQKALANMRRELQETERPAVTYNGCSQPINTREWYLRMKQDN